MSCDNMEHQAGAAAYISVKQTADQRREIRRTELDVIFKRLHQDRYIDIILASLVIPPSRIRMGNL